MHLQRTLVPFTNSDSYANFKGNIMMDSKLKMVKSKGGKMVPAFAADGKGKMKDGGMAKKAPAKAKKMNMGGMSKKAKC